MFKPPISLSSLRASKYFSLKSLLLFVGVFGAIGIYLILGSFAAAPGAPSSGPAAGTEAKAIAAARAAAKAKAKAKASAGTAGKGSANATTASSNSGATGTGNTVRCTVTESSLANINKDLAVAGASVCLTAGTYGPLVLTASPLANATLQAAAGAAVVFTGTINIFGSHLTLANMKTQDVVMGNYDETPGRPNAAYITLSGLTGRDFEIDSASNITVSGGSWGPASACGGPYGGGNNSIREPVPGVAPTNITIDSTVIHDVQSYNLTNCHIEGLAIFAGTNVTVSNTRFYGNSVYDIFTQANSGGSPNGLTIRDNWLAAAVDNSGANGRPVGAGNGIAFGDSGINSNVTFQGNRLNSPVNFDDNGANPTFANFNVLNNVGMFSYSGAPCGHGISFSKNVWQNDNCGPSDTNLNGAAMPFVKAANDGSLNYILTGVYAGWPG
jgi:hypothetical protein